MKNQKIAIIGPYYTSSGTTTHVKNIFRGFSLLDQWQPTLITYMEPNATITFEDLDGITENEEIKVVTTDNHKIYVFKEITPAKFYAFANLIANVCEKEGITILHPQVKPFVLFNSVLAAKILQKKGVMAPTIVATWHSNFGWIKDATYHFALAKMAINYVDGIIPVSQNVKEDLISLLGFKQTKILEIIPPGGIDYHNLRKDRKSLTKELIQRLNINEKYVVFLGRLLYNKGVDVLLKAFKEVLTELGSQYSLVVIGKGPFKEEYERLAKNLGLLSLTTNGKAKVVFTGYLPDEEVYALLQGAALFCLPSRWESFSISTLEAMAAGAPVICSAVGGLRYWVGDAALLVSPDSVTELKNKIKQVLLNPELSNKLKTKSIALAQEYDWRTLVKKTAKQIINCVKGQKRHIIDEQLDRFAGFKIDFTTGVIQNDSYPHFPKRFLVSTYGLFFPSEALSENNYFELRQD